MFFHSEGGSVMATVRKTAWCLLAVGVILCLGATRAAAIPVLPTPGSETGLGTPEEYPVSGGTVNVGSAGVPKDIYYSAGAGPWQKTFQLQGLVGNQLVINEFLHVSQGLSWTDWHEVVIGPTGPAGWQWSNPTLSYVTNGGGSGNVVGVINGAQVDFFFPAQPPSSTINITKTLTWGGAIAVPGTVRVDQWPTVPEPGTLVLLAMAGLSVLAYAWRKRWAK